MPIIYVENMAQTPKTPQSPAPQGPITRRALSRHQRELRRQRLVMIIVGAAIGLALLVVLIGVGYDRLWIPSRPIAQTGNTTLTRGGYWVERRNEIARQMAQNLQLLSFFGSQFGNQFDNQLSSLDAEVPNIRTGTVDDATVSGWIDRQILIQNAASEFNAQVSDGEIAQQLVSDLSRVFPEPAAVPTSTITLTPTAVIAPTAAPPTPTAGGPTATAAPPTATALPTATPPADVALGKQDGLIGRLYDAYQQEMLRISGDPSTPLKANLTLDDFKTGLHDQYLRQALTAKVEAQLLPEASFTPSTDPNSIEIRQILISTTTTLSDTQQQRDAALAARRPIADALLARLRSGADFAELAKTSSDDFATRADGGTLPGFDINGKTSDGRQMDPAIVAAALKLKENEISDLIQTPFGWHIIQLVKRNVDSKEVQLQDARSKKFDEWLAQKRAAATISRFPPVTPTPTTPPTPTVGTLPTVQLYATATATTVPTTTATLAATPVSPAAPTSTATTVPAATTAPAATSAATAAP